MTSLDNESRALRLVERQASQWELRRRLRQQGARRLLKAYPHLPEGPWVTFSRSEGSLGTEIAGRVAETLGWTVYGREIIETIARTSQVREKVLAALDEKIVGDLSDYMSRLSLRDYPGASVFVKRLMSVVSALGRNGEVVLVGRGAQFLLRPEFGLRVRVDAPLELRARRFAEARDLAPAEARRRVRRIDAQRQAWIRRYFHGELLDPLSFDLVLSTEQLDVAQAAEVVARTVRMRFEDRP
jgi:cytidylate kinase